MNFVSMELMERTEGYLIVVKSCEGGGMRKEIETTKYAKYTKREV